MKKIIYALFGIVLIFLASCSQEPSVEKNPRYYVQEKSDKNIVSEDSSTDFITAVINYCSVDETGKPLVLSGCISYPKDTELKQFVLCVHGTIFLNDYAPSRSKQSDGIENSKEKGRVIICPDYIGYGASVNRAHPYMNQELTAVNSLDMELAVLDYFKESNIPVSNDYYTVVTGYSQGGASALAVHKYIEEYLSEEKKSVIKFKESHCGGTPADLESTMDVFLDPPAGFQITGSHILLSFYVIQGMYISYTEQFKGKTLQDFYAFPLKDDSTENSYDVPYLVNQKTQSSIQTIWGLLGALDIKDVNNVYSQDMLTQGNTFRNTFIECLKKNNLTNWQPKNELFLYHSDEDDTVPYTNFLALTASGKAGANLDSNHKIVGKGTHTGFYNNVYAPKVNERLNSLE